MSTRLRTTLLAGVGFLLLQLGWILCLMPDWGIDEFEHAYRASSVADGHWEPGNDPIPVKLGRGDLIPVRADVVEAATAACTARVYTGVDNCKAVRNLNDGEVLVASAAARYNPTFYAVIGTIAKPFRGVANLFAMRAATALIACVLFMLTVWLAIAGARTVWPLVSVLLAALPTTVYSSAVAAPNGVELVAGLGTWVALLAVVKPREGQGRRSSYAALAVFAAVLANTHTLGLLWLGLIAVAVAIVHGPTATMRALLPRNRTETAAALFAACGVVLEVVWYFASGVNNPALERSSFSGNPWPYIFQGAVLWPLQGIGAFPMRNDPAPLIVFALIVFAVVVLAWFGSRRTPLRSRAVAGCGFIAAASYLVPAYLTYRSYAYIGSAWQGRYEMPFSIGLLVLVGAAIEASPRKVTRAPIFAGGAVVLMVVAQWVSQWAVVTGQRGDVALVRATGWVPPTAPLLVTLSVLAAVCWLAAVRPSREARRPDQGSVVRGTASFEMSAAGSSTGHPH
jgi:hypothetical protein